MDEASRYIFKERLLYFAYILVFIFLVLAAAALGIGGFITGGPGGIVMFLFALPFTIGATVIAIRLWGYALAEGFVFSLLASRRTLAQAALILSPYAGLIARGRGLEALPELEELYRQYPDTPEIAGMLASIYLNTMQDEMRFARFVKQYFGRSRRVEGADNLDMLLLYADRLGTASLPVLRAEAKKKVYMPSERQSIRNRIAKLTEKV